jgi:hypothetical protein
MTINLDEDGGGGGGQISGGDDAGVGLPVFPTDFDVLSDELPGDLYVLDDYNNGQIGNNRLRVLIEMNHEAFSLSFNRNDQEECEKVVQQIQSVTCQKGRFLSKPIDGSDMWKVLNEEQSKELVRQALRSPLPEKEILEPLDDLEPLSLTSTTTTAAAAAAAADDDDASESFEPIPLADTEAEVDFDDLGGLTSLGIGNLELNERLEPTDEVSSSDKKRGRRQSLLRRSVSESNFDKKKTYRNLIGEVGLSELSGLQQLPSNLRRFHSNADRTNTPPPARGLQRAATVSSSERALGSSLYASVFDNVEPTSFGGTESSIPEYSPLPVSSGGGYLDNNSRSNGEMNFYQTQNQDRHTHINPSDRQDNVIISQYSGMDVVLRNDCRALSPKKDIVGNNRLSVMISLQKTSYNTKSPVEQTKVASELVETVQGHWKARILVDTGFAYSQLGYSDATNAMKTLLSGPFTPGNTSASLLSSVSSAGTATSMFSSTSSNSTATAPTSSQHLLASAPPVPEFLRNASMEILNGGQGSYKETGPEQMQSAAIRSLQLRKAKRQMNKGKISGVKGGKKKGESSSSSLSPTPSGSGKDPPDRTASASSH